MTSRKEIIPFLVSAVIGAAAWLGLARWAGRSEAWDSPVYFSSVVPGLLVVAAGLGALFRRHAWRWGATLFAAQAVVMVAKQPTGSLLPLGLAFFGVLALGGGMAAQLGAYLTATVVGGER